MSMQPLANSEKSLSDDKFLFAAIGRLFWIGQLPIVFGSLAMVGIVAHLATDRNPQLNILTAVGFLCLMTSFIALYFSPTQVKLAMSCLYASLVLTLIYLSMLIALTGGAKHSPFHHLYLYLPAVVCTVVHKRKAAEIWTSVGVFFSYVIYYDRSTDWAGWKDFYNSKHFEFCEIAIVTILLVLLVIMNRTMERLVIDKRLTRQLIKTCKTTHEQHDVDG